MKKNVQRLLLAMALVLVVALAPQAAEAYTQYPDGRCEHGTPVTIHVNGEYLPCDVDPIIQNGRTLMPMRAAAEAIGANVAWDNATRCVTVQKSDTLAYFFVGSNTYYVNDAAMTSDVPAQIIDGRTMLPLRDFAEALGVRVDWDQYHLDVGLSTTGEKYSLPQIPLDVENDVARWLKKYYIPSNASDGIVGSWMWKNHISYDTYSYISYDFFYKTASGGYQNIEVSVSKDNFHSFKTILIFKNDAWEMSGNYGRRNSQNLIYFDGEGIGGDPLSENYYRLEGNNLINYALFAPAFTASGKDTYYDKNNIYTRF